MKKKLVIPPQKTSYFSLPAHTITWEQDLSHLKKNFSQKEITLFLDLYTQAQANPKKMRAEVENFVRTYPSHPEVLNLLSFIYLETHNVKKANHIIKKNYKTNPEYIFAKINYAHRCLIKKKYRQIPIIFNEKYNLPDLYPEKVEFHISEFRGFMVVMGLYYLAIKKREIAEGYHYLVYRVDPDHPNTKLFEKKLYHQKWYKLLMSKLKNFIN